MIYTFEQVKSATLAYFENDDLATDVWMKKYALKNNKEEFLELTPTDMHKRLAKEFARIEANYPNPMSYEDIFELFDGFKYVIPQGSPMSGIGNEYQVQSISNCFTIDSPLDAYSSILKTDQELVQIAKRRGGIGFDISNIRPKGMSTNNAASTTDGISVFMERYSNSTREVAQGGRRGALMITLAVNHPEIETFINIKRNLNKVTGANLSIRLSDAFMKAVENDEDFVLQWPVDSETPKITKLVRAKVIWNKIVDSAWAMAEPGLLFWDTVLNKGPADIYPKFKSISVNPCSEITLSGGDSCRLMLLNLTAFIENPFANNSGFDFNKYQNCVRKAQRLMDDLVDLELECVDRILAKIESDPEPENVKYIEKKLWQNIRQVAVDGRRTGLGVTGVGDMLAMLGITYGSDESIAFIEQIYKTLGQAAHAESILLAKERGAFPAFDYDLEKDHEYMNQLIIDELKPDWKQYGRRNIALTTTAPAGSVSTLTKTTSGIEPAFLLSYTRRRKINPEDKKIKIDFTDATGDNWQEYKVYHHCYKQWMDITGKTNVEESPYWKATSNDLDWLQSVKLQAAAQKWVDHAISRTCNLPATATKETVSDIYMEAWRSGCKGFTIYRDGCRSGVLISDENAKPVNKDKFTQHHAPKRPKQLPCELHHVSVKGDKWLIIIGLLENKPYEVFGGKADKIQLPVKLKTGFLIKKEKKQDVSIYDLSLGTTEDDNMLIKNVVDAFSCEEYATHTRLISLSLRHGIPVQYLVEQLQKDKNSTIFDFSKVIARVLKSFIQDGSTSGKCPECGQATLIYKEGCCSCTSCSFSRCS